MLSDFVNEGFFDVFATYGVVRRVSIIPRSAIFRDRNIDLSMASIVNLIFGICSCNIV